MLKPRHKEVKYNQEAVKPVSPIQSFRLQVLPLNPRVVLCLKVEIGSFINITFHQILPYFTLE